jgi:hypothetical protein
MTKRPWMCGLLAISLLLTTPLACGKGWQSPPTPTPVGVSATSPVALPGVHPSREVTRPVSRATPGVPGTATPSPLAAPPTSISGMALTDVQFALDLDQSGQLIYPATEFVSGVTRIYVRFGYRGLAGVTEVTSVWYLNENPVVADTLAWDGGEAGDYVIWMEDPNGIGRGRWRWELAVGGTPLGGGAFSIGGEPRYSNPAWGLSFDPPTSWKMAAEEPGFVTFSSPDQRGALALRVAPAAAGLIETASADLAAFQEDHPDAQVVATQDVTMSGKKALLQQVRYTDQVGGERLLYVVSALHAGSAYSLWMLGPADDATTLQVLLVTTLRSIRFTTKDE